MGVFRTQNGKRAALILRYPQPPIQNLSKKINIFWGGRGEMCPRHSNIDFIAKCLNSFVAHCSSEGDTHIPHWLYKPIVPFPHFAISHFKLALLRCLLGGFNEFQWISKNKTIYAIHWILVYPVYNQPQALKCVPANFEGNLATHWRKTCHP